MTTFSSRVEGLTYASILGGLVRTACKVDAPADLNTLSLGGNLTRIARNRARFIAERALEMPMEDRYGFVDRKVMEGIQ